MNRKTEKLLKTAAILLKIAEIAEHIIGFLLIPALLVFYGVINQCTWRYYVISIGIYLLLFALLEMALYFWMKRLDKKYTSFPERTVDKIVGLFHGDRIGF